MSIGKQDLQELAQGLGEYQQKYALDLARTEAMMGDPSRLNALMEQTMPKTSELTAAQKNYQFLQNLPEDKRTEFLGITGALRFDPERAKELEEAKREGRSPGGLDLTTGEKKVDESFAGIYTKWLGGEKQQAESNIANLENKLERLVTGQEDVSGPLIGATPDSLKPIIFPEATGFLDEVSDIVFQSLRATLGAQFTEQEGKRLIAATFNQSLDESLNLPRLQRLLAKIKSIYNEKQAKADFYNVNGTLKNYKSKQETFDSILDDILFSEYEQLNEEQVLERYKMANTAEERQSILRYAKQLKEKQK
jgi:hypothetical protein